MTAEFDTFTRSIWRDGDKSMARDSLGRGDETGDKVKGERKNQVDRKIGLEYLGRTKQNTYSIFREITSMHMRVHTPRLEYIAAFLRPARSPPPVPNRTVPHTRFV